MGWRDKERLEKPRRQQENQGRDWGIGQREDNRGIMALNKWLEAGRSKGGVLEWSRSWGWGHHSLPGLHLEQVLFGATVFNLFLAMANFPKIQVLGSMGIFFFFFYFLTMPCGMWDPSSPTRN